MNVKFISNHTKIRVESIVSGVGTSAKIHFEGDLVFGGFKDIELELLGLDPIKHEICNGLPLLLTFARTMPMGIFLPDATL